MSDQIRDSSKSIGNVVEEPPVQRLFELSGKNALVTGGTGHLGISMCRALAEAGACVIVSSRDIGRARAVAAKLPTRDGISHMGIQLDHLAQDGLSESLEACGYIDILVNNCVEHINADVENCTPGEFDRQLSNTTGYFLIARHVFEKAVAMRAPASIIMLGSMYGLVGSYPEVYEGIDACSPAAYHAHKGSVLQMTRYLSVYWARHGVRVNSLSPGPFPKNDALPELKKRLQMRSPMLRLGRPHELKGAIVFLASDASSYVTGHNLVVDGGWTAW